MRRHTWLMVIALASATVATLATFAESASANRRSVAATRHCSPKANPKLDSPTSQGYDSPPWVIALPGSRHDTEFCGPAHVVVRFPDGASFQIRGGQCVRAPGIFLVRIGILRHEQGAAAEYVGLYIHDTRASDAGTFGLTEGATSLIYATVEHRHRELAVRGGTITIAVSKRSGTFAFRLRDATSITGQWDCD